MKLNFRRIVKTFDFDEISHKEVKTVIIMLKVFIILTSLFYKVQQKFDIKNCFKPKTMD